jgi:hypothetical protein
MTVGTREWRKLHNEELHYMYCSPTIERVIKSRIMKWAGHVARMGLERRGKPEGRDHWGETVVDKRIILRWIFRRWDVGVWTRLSWLRIGICGGHL